MKKALIFLSLSLLLITSLFAFCSCGVLLNKAGLYEGFEYHVDSEYEITLTGYKGDKTKLEIPSWIDGYKVVGIAFDKSDESLKNVESIRIPKTILSISSDTFLPCVNLKEIKVALDNPEYKYFRGALYSKDGKTLVCYPQARDAEELSLQRRVSKIENNALRGARNLKKVTLSGTQHIGDFAFAECTSLETVELGEKIKSIGNGAFENCSAISSVVIPDTVESIGASAFKGCAALSSVSIGSRVGYVGSYAFDNVQGLSGVVEYEGVYYLGNSVNPYVVLIGVKEKDKSEYIVHPETNVIYGSAFEGCENLERIDLPNSLSCIGNRAFYNCKSLSAFEIPEAVSKIEEYAFYGCSSIAEMLLPSSVSEIGDAAFAGCASLEEITLSDRTGAIGHLAFSECTSLKSIILPANTKSIGNSVFAGCAALENISVSSNLEFIGEMVFDRCPSISYNEYEGAYYVGNEENPNLIFVKVIDASLTEYTVSENTRFIYEAAFYGCTKLVRLTIPEGVVYVGASAFEHCADLESVTIPQSVTYIGESAFFDCPYLASITVAEPNDWFTDENAIDPALLSDPLSASLTLKAQEHAIIKIPADNWVEPESEES